MVIHPNASALNVTLSSEKNAAQALSELLLERIFPLNTSLTLLDSQGQNIFSELSASYLQA